MKLKLRTNYFHLLIGINISLFVLSLLLSFLAGSIGPNPDPVIINYLGALNPSLVIAQGEYWRVISAIFLHASVLHIVLNMWALWQIGKIVEIYYGDKMLLTTYILSGVMGSVFSMLNLGYSFSVGASGAVFGLLGLLLAGTLVQKRFGLQLPFTVSDLLPSILLTLMVGLNPMLGIDNWAHIGGLVAGFVLGMIIPPHQVSFASRRDLLQKVLFIFSLFIMILSLIFMIISFFTNLQQL